MNKKLLLKSLRTLPKTLDETYERILLSIDDELSGYALSILRWLAFSIEPLYLNQLAEVTAINCDGDLVFDPSEKLEDPLDVLAICCSLVTIIQPENVDERRVVLSHFSVKEYLVSERIRNGPASGFHPSEAASHNFIAKSCIACLLHFQDPDDILWPVSRYEYPWPLWSIVGSSPSQDMDGVLWPYSMNVDYLRMRAGCHGLSKSEKRNTTSNLGSYAAHSWYKHARAGDPEDLSMTEAIMKLISPGNPAFASWLRIIDRLSGITKTRNLQPHPLCFAALFGFVSPVRLLLELNPDPVDILWSLTLASRKGHIDVTGMLLRTDVDLNQGFVICNSLTYSWRLEENYWPLVEACRAGQYEVAKLLIKFGASTNLETALQHPLRKRDGDMVRMLLELRKRVQTEVDSLETYHNFLRQALHFTGLTLTKHSGRTPPYKIIELILDNGGQKVINSTTKSDGYTLLHLAVDQAPIGEIAKAVDTLVARGADIHAQDKYGRTALHLLFCNSYWSRRAQSEDSDGINGSSGRHEITLESRVLL